MFTKSLTRISSLTTRTVNKNLSSIAIRNFSDRDIKQYSNEEQGRFLSNFENCVSFEFLEDIRTNFFTRGLTPNQSQALNKIIQTREAWTHHHYMPKANSIDPAHLSLLTSSEKDIQLLHDDQQETFRDLRETLKRQGSLSWKQNGIAIKLADTIEFKAGRKERRENRN